MLGEILRRTLLLGLVAFVAVAAGCKATGGGQIGSSCSRNADCVSGHCVDGDCVYCSSNSDCGPNEVCAVSGPRFLGSNRYQTCMSADAGCASSPSLCPEGYQCYACATGATCNDSTGECSQAGPPVFPTCGQSDPSGGFDAGTGPGPSQGGPCAACVGCQRGTECVCGASGLIGGVRCSDPAAGIACFFTGAAGECEIFAGDCATNTQCQGSPQTPLCSPGGNCVECLRDLDCRQDAGPQGCFNNVCGRCCGSNADCAPATPWCEKGFCYQQCATAADCVVFDAGYTLCCQGLCESGSTCPADAGTGPDGGPTPDAGTSQDGGGHVDGGDGG